jgi:hypothetical protein
MMSETEKKLENFRGVITGFRETAKGNFVFTLADQGDKQFYLPRDMRAQFREGDTVSFYATPSSKVPGFYFPLKNAVEVLKPAVNHRDLLTDLPEDVKKVFLGMTFYDRGILEGRYRAGAPLEDMIAEIKAKTGPMKISEKTDETKKVGEVKYPAETPPEPVFKTAAGEVVEVKQSIATPPKNVFNISDEIAELEIFLSKAMRPELTEAINREHAELKWKVRRTAFDIWKIGRMLIAEKETLPHGEWEEYCRRTHPEISMRTIQNYMKVANEIPKTQLIAFLDRLPTQTYRILSVVKPPKSKEEAVSIKEPRVQPPTPTDKNETVSFFKPEEEKAESWEAECPHCHRPIMINPALKTVEIPAKEALESVEPV